VLLPLAHGGGLLYAACLSCGLSGFGVWLIRSADPAERRVGRVLLASVGITLLIVCAYFVGYRSIRFARPTGDVGTGPLAALKMALRFLTMAFGAGGGIRSADI
jgi:hypothetical protein